MDDEELTIVIDNGSMSQVGFAGDEAPRAVFPACVGSRKEGESSLLFYIGDEAQSRCAPYALNYPVKGGIVENWDDMERVWHHLFSKELRVHPPEHPVLLTETPFNPKPNREKSMEIMFERFNVPSFYLAKEPAMSSYASGRSMGIVLQSGADGTYVVPVYEGACLTNNLQRLEIGGSQLTEHMVHLLINRGYSFTGTSEREVFRDIKEKTTFVSIDFKEEMAREEPWKKLYELPDGQFITLEKERFQCPEPLFQPSLLGINNTDGLPKLLHNAVLNCDKDLQRDLFCNFLLSGGNTMFPGMAARLQKDVCALASPGEKVMIQAPPERKFSTWIGGSILGSLSWFGQMAVQKMEYEEYGASIVHKRCF